MGLCVVQFSSRSELVACCDDVLRCLLKHCVKYSSTIEQLHVFVREVGTLCFTATNTAFIL